MNNYLEKLKENISKNKTELKKLDLLKKDYEKIKNQRSKELYEKIMKDINESIEKTNNLINKDSEALASFEVLDDNFKDIKLLEKLMEEENDSSLIDQASREINGRRRKIAKIIKNFPEEEREEILNDYFGSEKIEDNGLNELKNEKEKLEEDYYNARVKVEDLSDDLAEVFEEERTTKEDTIFTTEDKLNKFYDSYLLKKYQITKELDKAKKQEKTAKNKLDAIDKKIDNRARLVQEANYLDIDADTYKKMIDRVNEKKSLNKYLSKIGAEEKEGPDEETVRKNKQYIKEYLINNKLEKDKNNENKLPVKSILEKPMIRNNFGKPNVIDKVDYPYVAKVTIPAKTITLPKGEVINIEEKVVTLPVKGTATIEEIKKEAVEKAKAEISKQIMDDYKMQITGTVKLDDEILDEAKKSSTVNTLDKEAKQKEVNKDSKENTNNEQKAKTTPEKTNSNTVNPTKKEVFNNAALLESLKNKMNKKQNSNNNNNSKNNNNNSKNNDNGKIYDFKTIMYSKVLKGLQPEVKDGKRYRASNIHVREDFKNELRSGNYLYNIVHVVPAIVKVPIQLIRKLAGKITYRKDTKERMEIIKDRLNKLNDSDLEILYKHYANHSEVERFGTGVDILVNERITRYVNDKVARINKGLEKKYKEVFLAKEELDSTYQLLNNDTVLPNAKSVYAKRRQDVLKGKAQLVKSIRDDYEEAKSLLSSGLHGFNENIRATESKMSYLGRRFAIDHDLDMELLEKEAKLEMAELKAIENGDDLVALTAFIESERLLCENTSYRESIFGKRSTGKKYYSPLAKMLDYRNDPFIRDIFTTIAVTSAAVTTANMLNPHNKLSMNKQSEIVRANEYNRQVLNSVREKGNRLQEKNGTVIEGLKAQNYQNSLNTSNVLERSALDQSSEVYGGWSVGTNAYQNARNAAQNTYTDMYNATKGSIEDIATKYASGSLTQADTIKQLLTVSNTTQNNLVNVVKDALPHLQAYARDHSQFDLAGVEETMNYIVANPNAVIDMNNAMADVSTIGKELSNINIAQVTAYSSIPSNIRSTLFTAASSAALAANVASKMKNPTRQTLDEYDNPVTLMMQNYNAKKNKAKTK